VIENDAPVPSEGETQPPRAAEVESQPSAALEPEASGAERERPMISRKPSSRTALLLMTALTILVVDQVSKAAVREFLLSRGTNSVPLLDGWVRITYVENSGAAFGLLQDQTFLFVLIGMIVVVGILFGHRFLPTHRVTMALCLGLQLGGASGNLIDRIRHDGHVFDFIHVPPWPVFNVADSAIVVGVIILAYHLLFTSTKTQPEGGDPGK
jgi:signal peptidase II